MVAASSTLRRRLRRLPTAKPTPMGWLIDVYPDGRELEHGTGRPWPVPEFLDRPEGVPDLVLRLTHYDNEVQA